MIFSKASLQIMALTGNKNVPVFNSVCIEGDGTVVATNGRALALVSPVLDKIKDSVPLPNKENLGERIVLTASAVQSVIKAIPRDTQFRGLLEHCSMFLPEPGSDTVKVAFTDGKRTSEMVLRRMPGEYVTYEKLLLETGKGRLAEGKENIKCILNRKRMTALVSVIDKVCPYDGEFSPVYWEFTKSGNVIIRARNELTEQRLFSVFSTVEFHDGKWMEWDSWEERICGMGNIIDKKCPECGNHMAKDFTSGKESCSYVSCPSKSKRTAVRLSPGIKSLAQVNMLLRRGAVKLTK